MFTTISLYTLGTLTLLVGLGFAVIGAVFVIATGNLIGLSPLLCGVAMIGIGIGSTIRARA